MGFKCPICSSPVKLPVPGENGYFPFCSERCRMVDLGAWLDSEYKIKAEDSQDDSDRAPKTFENEDENM